MSFWEENKGTFKKAGIATAKGIGHGTKALSKAGYNTYKKHEAQRKGLPPPQFDRKDRSSSPSESLPPSQQLSIGSLPPPPKRTVAARSIPTKDCGERSSNHVSAQSQPQSHELSHQAQRLQQQQSQYESVSASPVLPTRDSISTPPIKNSQPSPNKLQPRLLPAISGNQNLQEDLTNRFSNAFSLAVSQATTQAINQGVQDVRSNYFGQPQLAPQIQNDIQEQAQYQSAQKLTQPNVRAYSQLFMPQPQSQYRQPVPAQPVQSNSNQSESVQAQPAQAQADAQASVPLALQPKKFLMPVAATPPSTQFAKSVDVSSFAPPPIHRGIRDQKLVRDCQKSTTSGSPLSSSHPSSPRANTPKSDLPPVGAGSNTGSSIPGPNPPVPRRDSEVPSPQPGHLASKTGNEPRPVKFVDVDISEFGAPPPKPYRLPETVPNPRTNTPHGNATAPSQYNTDSIHTPSNTPTLGILHTASDSYSTPASEQKQKKQPPPKPAKLNANVLKAEIELSPQPKAGAEALNFALEIANQRAKSEHLMEKPGPIKPAKPAKPIILEESERQTEQSVDDAALKKLPPPKPLKLASGPAIAPKPENITPISGTPARNIPPPPPKRGSSIDTPSHASPSPPPVPAARNYVRKPAPVPQMQMLATPESSSTAAAPEFELELSTGWYAVKNTPLHLPRDLEGLNYSTTYQHSSVGPITNYMRSITATGQDLTKVTYEIRWKNNDYEQATYHLVDFKPSPIDARVPSKQQLLQYSEEFGSHVVAWCLHNEGKQVGLGECWDLAHDALQKGCGNHAFVSTYYIHGYPILELHGSALYRGPEDEIRKGDILQFTSAVFENPAVRSRQTAGDPNHTAVVLDKIGDRIIVAEQNVQGARVVRRGEYSLSLMTSGIVTVYRPVAAEWAE